MEEKAELTTTSENQDTGNGARLNSFLVRWQRGKKRPAEIPLAELQTSSEEANEGNDGGKRLKSHEATRTVEKKTMDDDGECTLVTWGVEATRSQREWANKTRQGAYSGG